MITARDVEKVLSLLRRVYSVVVIDMSSVLNDLNLAFLDTSDTIVEIVTYDSTTIHNTVAVADTFRAIGYPASKVRYLVNRADSSGGIDPTALERALGRTPEHRVVSDGRLVVQANNEGVPVRPGEPGRRGQPGHRAGRQPRSSARSVRSPSPGAARQADVRSPADRGVRLRGGRPDRPARDPAADAGRIDGLPRRQRASPVRRPHGRRGRRVLDPVPRRPRRARRQGARGRLQHLDGGRADRPAPPLRPARARRDPPRRLGGRAGDPRAARRRDRDAGDDPQPRLLRRDQGREPGGRGLRARDARARAARRGRRAARTRWPRRPCATRWRRSSASATPTASPSSRGRLVPRSTRSCSAAPTIRCCGPLIEAVAGRGHRDRGLGDRPPPRRSPSCSGSTASRRPGGGAPATHLPADDRRPGAVRRARRPAVRVGRSWTSTAIDLAVAAR